MCIFYLNHSRPNPSQLVCAVLNYDSVTSRFVSLQMWSSRTNLAQHCFVVLERRRRTWQYNPHRDNALEPGQDKSLHQPHTGPFQVLESLNACASVKTHWKTQAFSSPRQSECNVSELIHWKMQIFSSPRQSQCQCIKLRVKPHSFQQVLNQACC